jgi:hypothetical protein
MMTAAGVRAAPATRPTAMTSIITEIKPVQPNCVERYSSDPQRRKLVITGTGMPSPRTTENLQFRRMDTLVESQHFGSEVNWASGSKVKIDMGTIHPLLWDDSKLNLQVRLTRYNTAFPKSQEPISDWSSPFLLANTIEACLLNLGDWQDLVSFRPAATWQQNVIDRTDPNLPFLGKWAVQYIEDGVGLINLDYYPVSIATLPIKPGTGVRFTGPEFVTFVRKNLNYLVDFPPGVTQPMFQPHDTRWGFPNYNHDIGPWSNDNPVGAVVSIEVAGVGGVLGLEYGAVLASKYKNSPSLSYWRFSSIYTQWDSYHPVSGNREFGIKQVGPHWEFYTRGADRTSNTQYHINNLFVFDGGHQVWLSFQRKLAAFINNNGGSATPLVAISQRYNWVEICRGYWYPTRAWIDRPIVRDEGKCW